MFHVDGDFGKVRLASHLPGREAASFFSYPTAMGWHRCNDLYRITRESGGETHLLLLTLGGQGCLRLGGALHELAPRTAAVLPAGLPMAYWVPPGGLWEFYWLHLGGPAARMLDYLYGAFGAVLPMGDAADKICRGVEDLLFMKKTGMDCFEARASRVIDDMAHQLVISMQERRQSLRQRDVVGRLLSHLETHYASGVSIKELSRSFYMSASHLTRLFKARTGFTPYEFLTRYRIQAAKELLRYTDLTVKEIAARTGFPRASHFIGRFRALEGVTPGDFRRQAGR